MRIQAASTFYTGTYSVLNTKRGSSFPYAMKAEGYGNTRKELFRMII